MLLYRWCLILTIVITSCGPSKQRTADPSSSSHWEHELSGPYFKGVLVVDPETNDTLVDFNSNKYFTPASNVKIFTLYSGIQLLSNQIPVLNYLYRGDTLYVEGTGDPTSLHPYFQDSTAVQFLKKYRNIVLHLENFAGDKYQPGWAWEDYAAYFSPELGPLPIYGNVVAVTQSDSLAVIPDYFRAHTFRGSGKKLRNEKVNTFFVPYTLDTLHIPFITGKKLTKRLLENVLQRKITRIDSFPQGDKKTLLGISADSVFKEMMHKSDNFLAEQLMLMASSQISDTLSFSIVKNHVLENQLKDLRQQPRWVDGSGLSRYNLFTPQSMVQVLHKLYDEVPQERLFNLFPYWKESGTLESADGTSYIIAKSGSLGNNYNLSGYLVTKSGKILIFSFMNNHFRIPAKTIKKEIMKTLRAIHYSN